MYQLDRCAKIHLRGPITISTQATRPCHTIVSYTDHFTTQLCCEIGRPRRLDKFDCHWQEVERLEQKAGTAVVQVAIAIVLTGTMFARSLGQVDPCATSSHPLHFIVILSTEPIV
jgi:hypothetical protein